MLHKNQIFDLDGQLHRLLHVDEQLIGAWTIDIKDEKAWPVLRRWNDIKQRSAVEVGQSVHKARAPQGPARQKAAEALKRLGDLVNKPGIYDEAQRGHLVNERATEVGCSRTTLYKDLRRYFVGGQTESALAAKYINCGVQVKGTAGRGRRSSLDGHKVYQLTQRDLSLFESFVKSFYLNDERRTMKATYQRLVEKHYSGLDGNGDSFVLPVGERPSLRQLTHFIHMAFPLETRLRSRKGEKDFARQHRPTLGTVLADCLSVGHFYEADATIADIYLVAEESVERFVGKPTIYLVVDRKSRLIVGWYVGLENPSWVCAKEAILSISEDKAAMCARYGVEYRPEDWPAHCVHPKSYIADRGELITKVSTQLVSEMDSTVVNVPGQRPDWKPVVESDFKQVRATLANSSVPGYDPPENAMRRQGKHYEKDACMTLKQFSAFMLNGIIAHNRALMPSYDLSLKELADNVLPSPIALWNHGIVERSGLLARYPEEHVRMALLPRTEGTVSGDGIKVQNCFYTCPEAVTQGWFTEGRQKTFKVEVSYDTRSVDTVYVHDRFRAGRVLECTLNDHSEKYRAKGLSFAEVHAFEKFQALLKPLIEQSGLQTTADFHKAIDPIVTKAKKRLAQAGTVSRSARRADTKKARAEELKKEQKERLGTDVETTAPSASVIALHQPKPSGLPPVGGEATASPADTSKPLSLHDRVRKMRERALHG